MTATVSIEDKKSDPDWLECVIQDLWDLVKEVRNRSGPKQRTYSLIFGPSHVTVTIRREN